MTISSFNQVQLIVQFELRGDVFGQLRLKIRSEAAEVLKLKLVTESDVEISELFDADDKFLLQSENGDNLDIFRYVGKYSF